ncbi:DnaJ- protein scj1 [Coelomomyces lativittatus]|nr:DnaJ- protein scj1 [Coelomomyces lativittatus]
MRSFNAGFVLLLGSVLVVLAIFCSQTVSASDDYYEVLGISRDATEAEIKKAGRKAGKVWHPDLHPPDKKEYAQKMFQKVSHAVKQTAHLLSPAYEVLKDKEKRAIYDQYGEEGLKQQQGRQGGGGFRDPFDIFGGYCPHPNFFILIIH